MDSKHRSTSTTTITLLPQLRKLARGAQFYWYLALVTTIWYTGLCMFSSILRGTSHPTTIRHYSSALLAILVTYLIILRQTYKNKPPAYVIGQIWHLMEHLLGSRGSSRSSKEQASHRTAAHPDPGSPKTAAGAGTGGASGSSNPGSEVNTKPSSATTAAATASTTAKTNILRDENVQYLLFAFFHWLFASPFFGPINPSTLYPFAIYAIFHASHYSQTSIIPYLPYVATTTKQRWCATIVHFHRLYNERSRMLASNTEVLLVTFYLGPFFKLFFRIALGRFWSAAAGGSAQFWYDFKTLVLCLVTIVFLRARFAVDAYTRTQIQSYDALINRFVWHPMLPQQLRQLLMGLRKVVGDFVEMVNIV
ncbi:hypothetical protein PICMEDRAFT_71598 [Pichia membranifaciens NRRL Y-2026]|uniref:Uncharacterized protein n=1 Tax=Pichia membranifaciens NRRL Y-2026 TaxID=763406 RepID=A0A1E3NPA5_9ASCO|nr:hypothetical protein PICMEDRAFT_71598 [Pichia membranifaciens NRRL Y-2026]ODQ47538.1 hypothetical protein PICMEDRAFT_71598 [Pichia membranifaciens NRRL Y-2026]